MYKVDNSIINWLLEDENPPVKYLTLTKLLDEKEDSSIIQETIQKINTYKPIADIFAKQKENSYWFDKKKNQNYKKYLGTYWQLLFLYEMHAQKNKRITNAIEHIFSTGQAPNGGFLVSGTNSLVAECLTANMLRVLIHYDYLDDDRTHNALEFLLNWFVDRNGKIRCQTIGLLKNCYMVMPKILFALSMIPEKKRNPRVTKGINLCVERLLDNQIYKYLPEKNNEYLKYIREKKLTSQQRREEKKRMLKENPDMAKVAKTGWTEFSFPHSYTSDALDAMRSLVSAKVKYSNQMSDALELIKNNAVNGAWINKIKTRSPMHTQIEEVNQKSKWLTFHALSVLKFYEKLEINENIS
ncbi:MAG: hypothetical protein HZR80_16335 [Candidatus Heimdallarchaeota archaeon]